MFVCWDSAPFGAIWRAKVNSIVMAVLQRLDAAYPDEKEDNRRCVNEQFDGVEAVGIDASDKIIMVGVLTMQVAHRYQGFCPEQLQGEMRDPYCVACECLDRLLEVVNQHVR